VRARDWRLDRIDTQHCSRPSASSWTAIICQVDQAGYLEAGAKAPWDHCRIVEAKAAPCRTAQATQPPAGAPWTNRPGNFISNACRHLICSISPPSRPTRPSRIRPRVCHTTDPPVRIAYLQGTPGSIRKHRKELWSGLHRSRPSTTRSGGSEYLAVSSGRLPELFPWRAAFPPRSVAWDATTTG